MQVIHRHWSVLENALGWLEAEITRATETWIIRLSGRSTSILLTRSSLLSWLLQPVAGADQLPRLTRLNGLQKRPRCVSHLVLNCLVAVESLMAGRIGLPVTDVAVEFGRNARRDQMHESQPVDKASANIFGPLHIP